MGKHGGLTDGGGQQLVGRISIEQETDEDNIRTTDNGARGIGEEKLGREITMEW